MLVLCISLGSAACLQPVAANCTELYSSNTILSSEFHEADRIPSSAFRLVCVKGLRRGVAPLAHSTLDSAVQYSPMVHNIWLCLVQDASWPMVSSELSIRLLSIPQAITCALVSPRAKTPSPSSLIPSSPVFLLVFQSVVITIRARKA